MEFFIFQIYGRRFSSGDDAGITGDKSSINKWGSAVCFDDADTCRQFSSVDA